MSRTPKALALGFAIRQARIERGMVLVPALLQTDDYVRAIMTAGGVPDDEIGTRINNRISRRQVLDKPLPPNFLALLGTATLRQSLGGHDAAIEQAKHLLAMARMPNVEIRIIPDGVGWHPALDGAFSFIEAGRPNGKGTIAFIDTRLSPLMVYEARAVEAYRQAVDWLLSIALNRESSARYILEVANRLEQR